MFFSLASSSLSGAIVRRINAVNPDYSIRNFSKYLSKSAAKRIPLTTKRAKKGFYKGKGCTKEGYLTSKGRFVVDWTKRLQLIVPDLTGFKLKPVRISFLYISLNVEMQNKNRI